MEELQSLKRGVHDKINDLRCLERILEKPIFEEVFKNTPEQEKRRLERYIKDLKIRKIRLWVSENNNKDLEEMPVSKLRKLAAILSIPYYGILSKDLLISAINSCKGELDEES